METLKTIRIIIWYFIRRFLNHLLSEYLLRTRKDDYFLTEEKFEHIKKCVNLAYPGVEHDDYNDYNNVSDFLEKMLCGPGQLYVLTGNGWYLIVIRQYTHIVGYDFASATGKCTDIMRIYRAMIDLFRGKRVFIYSREITSYRLLKAAEKRGDLRIIKDKIVLEDDEQYHKMLVKIEKRRKRQAPSRS